MLTVDTTSGPASTFSARLREGHMPRTEMLQAGLMWVEKELNGWAGDIEGEGEIVRSSEDVARRLRDIAQSIRTALEFSDAVAEAEARRADAA